MRNLPKNVKRAAAGLIAMTAAGTASAGQLADAVTNGVDTAELLLIGVCVLTVSGIIFLIRSGKKTAN